MSEHRDPVRMTMANVMVSPITSDRDGQHRTLAERLMATGLALPEVRALRHERVAFGVVTAVGPGHCVGAIIEQETEQLAEGVRGIRRGIVRPGAVVAWVLEDSTAPTMVHGEVRFLLWGRAIRAVIDESDSDGPTAGVTPVGWQVLTSPDPIGYEICALGQHTAPEDRDVLLVGERSDDIRRRNIKVGIERVLAQGRGARVVREVSRSGVLAPDCIIGSLACVESLTALPLRIRGRDLHLVNYGRVHYAHESPAELERIERIRQARPTSTADAVRAATR